MAESFGAKCKKRNDLNDIDILSIILNKAIYNYRV